MRSDPERLAWRILVAAFFTFLLLCSSVVYLIQWFLWQSTVDLARDLAAARGTVTVTLPNTDEAIAVAEKRSDLVNDGTTIQTDSTSQAVLTFSHPKTGQPVASLVLFRDSEIVLTLAKAPRFGVNRSPYRIQISSPSGSSQVLILDNDPRSVEFEIISPQASTQMTENGKYAVVVSEQNTRVTTYSGRALVIGSDERQGIDLADDERVVITADGEGPDILEAEQSILTNGDFTDLYENGWNFYNDREPPGTAQNVIVDGRTAVMIDRSQSNWPDETLGHGESGLVQFPDTDVSEYSYLEIQATFYIDEQSLSTCGVAGSECPLMIRIRYLDPNGQEQVFIHGFYAAHDPGLDFPTTCATCRAEHERISFQSWYTYQSGNLITLAPTQRPVHITELSFYASGHAYKIYVSEIALLAAE
jgi:hypothetical protein